MGIPKIVNYCWFGGEPKSDKIVSCISSWTKYLPDYKIVEWNEKNFNVNCNRYCKEAYLSKKYAFVSDYARLWILFNYGGLYFDTDIEVLKPLDRFLEHSAFSVFSKNPKELRTNFMGSVKNHPWIKRVMEYYNDRVFIKSDGSFDMTPNTCVGAICHEMYCFNENGCFQLLKDDVALYPNITSGAYDFETGKCKIKKESYVIHWNTASFWSSEARKEWRKQQKYKRLLGKKCGSRLYFLSKHFKDNGFRKTIKLVMKKVLQK